MSYTPLRRCEECGFFYENSLEGLQKHIFNSKEHNEYVTKWVNALKGSVI